MFFLRLFDLTSFGFASSLALIDAFTLSCLKAYNLGWIQWPGIILVTMIIYSLQPLLFLESFQFSTLTVMNLLRDVLSDVLVTSIGLFYFSEKISNKKKIGVFLSIISMILLTWKEN